MIKRISVLVSTVFLLQVFLLAAPVRAEGGLTVLESSAEAEFPCKLNFNLSAESDVDITDIRLYYTVDRQSFARVISEVYIEFMPGTAVDTGWTWDMRKTGGLPPGTTIRYWWTLEDAGGARIETSPVTLQFDDSRFTWQHLRKGSVTIFWYEGDQSFIEELMGAALDGLGRLYEETGVELGSPVEIYIYANSQDLQSAMIFPQSWTGGVAYPRYSTIAIGIEPDNLSWGTKTIVHELTHLVIHKMTYTPYLDLPTWLDEGLAMYMEGPLDGVFNYYLNKAVENDTLISVRSLSSPFSAYADQSYLSYAQSYGLVFLLINGFGQEKMLELLTVFSKGSGYDEALEKVYGFDLDGLDAIWHDYIEQLYSQQYEEFTVIEPSFTTGTAPTPAL